MDEYQDTNHSQYIMIKLLSGIHRNLCVVGDEDQCIPAGELVQDPRGEVPIESISAGQTVIGGAACGTAAAATVQDVK